MMQVAALGEQVCESAFIATSASMDGKMATQHNCVDIMFSSPEKICHNLSSEEEKDWKNAAVYFKDAAVYFTL